MALFIGSFLVINTFTMLVARRTREIALLRAVGATRRQVVRSLLAEAVVVGVVASVLGFVLGLGIASVMPELLSTDGNRLPSGPLEIGIRSIAAALFVGVGVTVLAAWLPARRAARIAPVEALRSVTRPAERSRLRTAAGLGMLLLGVGLLVSLAGSAEDASEENLRSAMLGCGVLVVALILLSPVVAPPVIRLTGRLSRRFGIAGRLAQQNALRDPRRTAATAATLLISTALVSGLATIGASTGQALDRQTADGLGADYVISTGSTMTGIDPAAVQRVATTPGVRTASEVADSTAVIGGKVREISGVDPGSVGQSMKLDFVSGSLKDLGPGRIAVSSSVAREAGVRAGGQINAQTGRREGFTQYTVVGVYRDNPTARDAVGTREEVQRNSFKPGSVQRILVRGDGVSEGALRTAVSDNPLLKVQDRAALVREAAGTMGDLLALMYGLLAIGVVISALGIVNTLAMSVTERTREIGALRALGMDRPGIRRMIRLEAVTVAAFGTLLGLAGGLFGSWAVGALVEAARWSSTPWCCPGGRSPSSACSPWRSAHWQQPSRRAGQPPSARWKPSRRHNRRARARADAVENRTRTRWAIPHEFDSHSHPLRPRRWAFGPRSMPARAKRPPFLRCPAYQSLASPYLPGLWARSTAWAIASAYPSATASEPTRWRATARLSPTPPNSTPRRWRLRNPVRAPPGVADMLNAPIT